MCRTRGLILHLEKSTRNTGECSSLLAGCRTPACTCEARQHRLSLVVFDSNHLPSISEQEPMNTPEDSVEEEFGSSKLLPNLLTITTHRVETLTNPTLLSPATGLLVDRRRLAARYARRLAGISSLEDGSAYRSRAPHSTIQTRYHRFSLFFLSSYYKKLLDQQTPILKSRTG